VIPIFRTRPSWKPAFEQSAWQRLAIAALLCGFLWAVVAWALT